jgi:signal transduction histidine kinase
MPESQSEIHAHAARQSGGDVATWLPAERELSAAIAAHDWSQTALGPLSAWAPALRRTVLTCMESSFPFALAWGPERVQLYNDAFLAICGSKHPHQSLGLDMRECWASTWSEFGPHFDQASRGVGSQYVADRRVLLDRNGIAEEAFLSFAFSPVRGGEDPTEVAGVLLSVVETTRSVLSERRARVLREVVAAGAGAASVREALAMSVRALEQAAFDVPFAAVYLFDPASNGLDLVESTQSARGVDPAWLQLLPEVGKTGQRALVPLVTSAGRENPASASAPTAVQLLPITLGQVQAPYAVLVSALSPRLPLNAEHELFFERLAGAVTTNVMAARAHEEQRRRAEQLSALDRAKTTFFANVSHEFRTPLTLLAGPLEDELAERERPLPSDRRERLVTAHRNTQRLIKLVNVLLDFSRIEAGQAIARYRPTQLGTLTSELASMFRPAIERAGLTLAIDIEPKSDPVFVDREMWEKIVLNLLSNAFKHTFEGRIDVCLRFSPSAAELTVTDTGTGIEARELPHLFERFHRVVGARSRTHEGTGIGLALVRELARLHGGDVSVASKPGQGTAFTVTIPLDPQHLPQAQIGLDAEAMPPGADVAAYVQEALNWSPAHLELPAHLRGAEAGEIRGRAVRGKVLLADDNADMRAYISRLLEPDYAVAAVADGQSALDLVASFEPDLVLSDVMMPRLDGPGVLRALRSDPSTRHLPVVLLSARAGEESAIEGIEAGADDYLVKPFSARELLARVRTHVELARARREWADYLERTNQELEAFSYSVSHDLRTPLRAIDGFSKAVLSRKAHQLDEEGKDYLMRVRRAAARMGELIDELLDLSRVSRAPLQRQSVALTALANHVAKNVREQFASHTVHFEADPDLTVHADPRLLRSLLENLLDNSWKFTARRGDAKVHVGQVAGAAPPTYFIMDNGAGFDQTYVHRLFQPFQRLHAESDFPGTGIGLAIVHRIVSRHGGRIWAEGHENRGATIYFTLTGKT